MHKYKYMNTYIYIIYIYIHKYLYIHTCVHINMYIPASERRGLDRRLDLGTPMNMKEYMMMHIRPYMCRNIYVHESW